MGRYIFIMEETSNGKDKISKNRIHKAGEEIKRLR